MENIIDSSIHLYSKAFSDKKKIIIESKKNKINTLILTGTTYENSLETINFCYKYNNVIQIFCTIGTHPHKSLYWDDTYYKKFKDIIIKNKQIIVAIGECGLDYYNSSVSKEHQIKCFKDQILLSQELNIPLLIYENYAINDLCSIIKEKEKISPVKGVIHCFIGNYQDLITYLNMGLFIGFSNYICDDKKNAKIINTLNKLFLIPELKFLFLNKFIIETNSPCFTYNNKKNHPKNIYNIIEKLSKILNIHIRELSLLCYSNTIDFFSINK